MNFDALLNGGGAPYHIGNFTIQTNQGVANTSGLHGEVYGTLITVTDSAEPFTLTSVDLGLFGTSNGAFADNVTLVGIDTHGTQITYTVNLGATIALGSTLTYTFNAAGTPFEGVSLASLQIKPQHDNNFNGSVIIDNLTVATGAAPATTGAVYFTDLSNAANNVSITDGDGHAVSVAGLTSGGLAVKFALIDQDTWLPIPARCPAARAPRMSCSRSACPRRPPTVPTTSCCSSRSTTRPAAAKTI